MAISELLIKPVDERQFGGMRELWNDLLSRSSADNVFLRWEWIHTWWQIYGPNRTLFILAAWESSRLAGLAPFYIEPARWPQPRMLKFCADELAPDYLDIIAEKGRETEVARQVISSLLNCRNVWDVLSLTNMREDSVLLKNIQLLGSFPQISQIWQSCPYIRIEGSFADFYKSRQELKRFMFDKKLEVLYEAEGVTHKIVRDEAALSKGLADLFSLHEKRAITKNIDSEFISEKAKRFHAALSRAFLKENILNLQLLYQGSTPLSALYGFRYKDICSVYQSGFDPLWSKWSVGGVLWYLAIQDAFQQGLKEFDFLKGMELYKTLWTNSVRQEMYLGFSNRNVRGLLWWSEKRIREACQKMRRLGPGRTPSGGVQTG